MSLVHPFAALIIDATSGQLLLTPCPGSKEVSLRSSLEQLAAAGAAAVITLMPSDEMQNNAVADLPELCTQLGLTWFHLPVEDDHAPEQPFEQAWQAAQDKIHALLDAGESIAIHCKGGTGRTGMLAAKILLQRGIPLNDVIERVRAVRPNALTIPLQLDYISNITQ